MGPLIPNNIIDSGWSYLIAFIIGIAFGAVLEASGFSSSRKIVGTFYGYDFTVLRVFMTATIVAMLGLLYFNYLGWMDLSMIYFPPTFLYSVLLGGFIMGLGFIIGGFCPGTGICAMAIGKLDAAVFIVGLYLGILLFAEIYPYVEEIYTGHDLGNIRVTDSLGISSGLFAFLFVVVSIIAFAVASYVQRRVTQ